MLVQIGYVARAHGVRGELRIEGTSSRLDRMDHLFLDGNEQPVESARPSRDAWLVKLRGIDDRDRAETFKGCAVQVRRADLPPAAEDEVYLADLIGCALVDRARNTLGIVVAVESTGAQDLLVVERERGQRALVPFVEPIVVEVDLPHRSIVCDPPEGLFEL